MTPDPIVEEIRRIRDENARRHNYDAQSMGREFLLHQQQSGRRIVDLQAKKAAQTNPASQTAAKI